MAARPRETAVISFSFFLLDFSSLSSSHSFFFLGICLSRQGGFEPWSLCSSEACGTPWHLLMSMLMTQALSPSLLTYLKKKSTKKAHGFYFWVGSQNLFMNAFRTPRGKTKWKGSRKVPEELQKSTAGMKSYFSWQHRISIGTRRQTEIPFFLNKVIRSNTVKWRNKPGFRFISGCGSGDPVQCSPAGPVAQWPTAMLSSFVAQQEMEVYQC